jgi:hypothetical protein
MNPMNACLQDDIDILRQAALCYIEQPRATIAEAPSSLQKRLR